MKAAAALVLVSLAVALGGCGSSSAPASATSPTGQAAWEQPVPKAACGAGDAPEPALQGQVTLAERFAGFKGTRCNLQLVGAWAGQGAGISHAAFGHCDYFGQAASIGVSPASVALRPGLANKGVVVVDVTDPAHPAAVEYLSSTSFIEPWESLKVNERRKLLAAVNGLGGGGGPELDLYDLSGDCAHPRLLSSVALSDSSLKGHEGNWAPDGETYYGGDVIDNSYYAVDVKDPAAPRLITRWSPSEATAPNPAAHGLSIRADGNRGYFVHAGDQQVPASLIPGAGPQNGFDIVDTSEIQARKPNPQIRVLSTVLWKDGSSAQHTIPILIKGHPYLVHVDELGPGGVGSGDNWAGACAAGLPPFGMARIFDIADETQPRLVAKLMLQVHDPANCGDVVLDNTGQVFFGYDSHQCSVDDPNEAGILMCGQFSSGLRVYDIRDPYHPREIAYYNPPAKPGYQAASTYNLTGICGNTDWTASIPVLKKDADEIWFTSACNGFQVVRFTNGAWPFSGASAAASGTRARLASR